MKRAVFLLLGLIFLILIITLFLPKRGPVDGTILIIRHAEKPEVGGGLSRKGMDRAEAYKKYFASYQIDSQPLRLAAIYASADTQESQRPRVTVQPLATSLHLSTDATIKKSQVSDLASELRATCAAKQALVCWHHGEIPSLLKELGVDAKSIFPDGEWPDRVFDWVIELRFNHDGLIRENGAKRFIARILPGD